MPSRTRTRGGHWLARLTTVLTAVLMGLLLGSVALLPATATPPFVLPDQITDQVGAVEGHTAEIQAAFDDLEAEHGVRMWVVFVDTFDGVDPQQWADQTFAATDLGVEDYLLAVAMTDRQYGYIVDQAFVLDDAALARVATAAERHLAENPPRAVTEAARAISDEVVGTASSAAPTTDGSQSVWGVLGVALAVVVGVVVVCGLLLYLGLRGHREGPGPGYGPQDTSSGSTPWWGGSSDTWSSSVSSGSGWSGGSDSSGGDGNDTRGGSGSF